MTSSDTTQKRLPTIVASPSSVHFYMARDAILNPQPSSMASQSGISSALARAAASATTGDADSAAARALVAPAAAARLEAFWAAFPTAVGKKASKVERERKGLTRSSLVYGEVCWRAGRASAFF